MNEEDIVSFTDLEDEQPDTSIGEDTFGLEDDWGQWDTNAWTRDTQDVGEVRGGGTFTVQTRDGGGFGTIIQQVTGVDTITFDSAVFLIQDNGGGEVVVYCAT